MLMVAPGSNFKIRSSKLLKAGLFKEKEGLIFKDECFSDISRKAEKLMS